MSFPNSDRVGAVVSGTALVWAIAVMFSVSVAAVTVIAVVVDSDKATLLIGQVLGSFATLVVALGALFKIGQAAQTAKETKEAVDQVAENTNGKLDARVRTLSYQAVTRALEDHMAKHNGDAGI